MVAAYFDAISANGKATYFLVVEVVNRVEIARRDAHLGAAVLPDDVDPRRRAQRLDDQLLVDRRHRGRRRRLRTRSVGRRWCVAAARLGPA